MNGIMITQKEEWRDVVGYEGLYKVSDQGRVYSVRYKRVMSPGRLACGYMQVVLCKNGVKEQRKVHRLVGEAFLGPLKEGYVYNHLNQTRSDNRACNLKICSYSENVVYGNANALRKMKDEDLTPQQLEYRNCSRKYYNHEKKSEYEKKRYKAHREEFLEKSKKNYEAHREARLAQMKKRQEENREKISAYVREWRVRKRAAMSEEELKEYRAKDAARAREYRARKKAEKLAKNQNLNLDSP